VLFIVQGHLETTVDPMLQPFGNLTTLPPAQWHPEPEFRGTFGILSSCLITMSLCIWTSLHLNLPEHGKEHHQPLRQIKWMILGLIVPELVVFNAWKQRKRAKRISKIMREKQLMADNAPMWSRLRSGTMDMWNRTRQSLRTAPTRILWSMTVVIGSVAAEECFELPTYSPPQLCDGRKHYWTDVHSWYVVMGGFAFEDHSPEDQQFMRYNRRRTTVAVDGFEWLVENRLYLVPDISLQFIRDKSKTDSLAKLLTCWQASYFCIQCVFRLIQHLPVALLELNVFAHALCALSLLLLWWDKPRDIREPFTLEAEEALDVCAFFTIPLWAVSCGEFNWRMIRPLEENPRAVEVTPDATLTHIGDLTSSHRESASEEHASWRVLRFRGGSDGSSTCLNILGTYWWVWQVVTRSNTSLVFSNRSMRRFARAYKIAWEQLLEGDVWGHGDANVNRGCARISNIGGGFDELLEPFMQRKAVRLYHSSFGRLVFCASLAGGFYGGLHLTAWATPFTSHAQMVLWRAASITTIATGLVYGTIVLCIVSVRAALAYPLGDGFTAKEFDRREKLLEAVMMFPAMTLFLVWYTLCRAYLVVECFIMLAHLPNEALRLPSWSAYIPHIV